MRATLGLLAGIVAGVLSAGDAGAYARARPTTAAEVDGTLARFSQAETEALAANILYVVGGVLVAAGITWELAAGREDGTSPLSLAPWFGPSSVGLALNGDLGVSL